jgi:tetratricopeptide (TPR) repeat protein
VTISPKAGSSDLEILSRGIDLGKGVAFYYLVVDDALVRDQAIAELASLLRRRRIRRIRIREGDDNLLDLLRQLPSRRPDEVIVVMGIENVVQDSAGAPFIRSLNAARDAFAKAVQGPVLFVIPSYVLKLIVAGAPDFFSAQSGTDFYKSSTERWRPQILHQSVGRDLPATEGRDITEEAEQLLAQLHSDKSPEAYLRRSRRLVDLLLSQYHIDRAEEIASEAFRLAKKTDPRQALQFASYLAQIARLRGDMSAARRFADEVGILARHMGDSASELRALWLAADSSDPDDPGIERLYLEALNIADRIADVRSAAQIEMSLANLNLKRGKADLALKWLTRAQVDTEKLGDRPLLAEILSTKAAALVGVGRLAEAEDVVRQSIRVFERIGDTVQLSMGFVELGDVYLAQGLLESAEEAFRRSLDLVQKSAALPTRAIVPLLRLVNIKLQRNDASGAEGLAREALSLIEQFRNELPDSESVERELRKLMDDASHSSTLVNR